VVEVEPELAALEEPPQAARATAKATAAVAITTGRRLTLGRVLI
jgi:hypothetical protein